MRRSRPVGTIGEVSRHRAYAARLAAARDESEQRDLVSSRDQLAALGIDARAIRREVDRGRWALHGRQTVALHTAPLSDTARRWRAVYEVGTRIALVDGISALQAAGLAGLQEDGVHVSVPHTASVTGVSGVRIHKVIRRVVGEAAAGGLPRTLPAVAAVRAAHWAGSNRHAAMLLAMTVQQRLTTGERLVAAETLIRGRNRRRFIQLAVHDIARGAHSLGELDFRGLCRRYRLPAPTHQVVRRGPRGRIYLDAGWEDIGLFVEIDGAGHGWGLARTDDLLRQNAVTLDRGTVLRIDVLGLRLEERAFMEQVVAAYDALRRRAA